MLSFNTLKSEFENTKHSLSEIELNIKRLTGRDADQYTVTADGNIKLKIDGKFPGKPNGFKKRRTIRSLNRVPHESELSKEEESPGEEEEEEEDENVAKKPALQSTVIAAGRNAKSRKDMIKDQYYDSNGLARNRRIFDFVRGTLQKFQHEEGRRTLQEKKKAEINQKLEEAAEKEKQKMKKEKEQMFLERREKKIKMRSLEKKMEIVEMHETWEKNQNYLKHFIKTETKPYILFLPAKHNDNTRKALKEEKERRIGSINARRAKVKRELSEIDYLYTRDDKNDENLEVTVNKIESRPHVKSRMREKEASSDDEETDDENIDNEVINHKETSDQSMEINNEIHEIDNENIDVSEQIPEVSEQITTTITDSTVRENNDKETFSESLCHEDMELIYDE